MAALIEVEVVVVHLRRMMWKFTKRQTVSRRRDITGHTKIHPKVNQTTIGTEAEILVDDETLIDAQKIEDALFPEAGIAMAAPVHQLDDETRRHRVRKIIIEVETIHSAVLTVVKDIVGLGVTKELSVTEKELDGKRVILETELGTEKNAKTVILHLENLQEIEIKKSQSIVVKIRKS